MICSITKSTLFSYICGQSIKQRREWLNGLVRKRDKNVYVRVLCLAEPKCIIGSKLLENINALFYIFIFNY